MEVTALKYRCSLGEIVLSVLEEWRAVAGRAEILTSTAKHADLFSDLHGMPRRACVSRLVTSFPLPTTLFSPRCLIY